MRRHILLAAIIVALAPGCASVSTRLALLDPAHSYAPASHTDILWQEPPRRFVVIASMDSTAAAGSSDAALFEHAKAEAGAIGADAIIVLETGWRQEWPALADEPQLPPRDYPFSRQWRRALNPPLALGYADAPALPGGSVRTLKTLAIKYQ